MTNGLISYHLSFFWKRIIAFMVIILFLYMPLQAFIFKELALFISIIASSMITEKLRISGSYFSFGIQTGNNFFRNSFWLIIYFFCTIIVFFILLFILQYKLIFNNVNFVFTLQISFLIIIISLTEELIFRGILFQSLVQRFSFWKVAIVSTILFALLHFVNSPLNFLAFVNVFIASIFLYYLFFVSKSLWLPAIFHILWNLVQALFFDSPVSGFNYEISIFKIQVNNILLWTNREYGFESGLLSLVFLIIGFIVFSKIVNVDAELTAFNFKRDFEEYKLSLKRINSRE